MFVNPERSEPALQVPSLYWPNSEVNTDPPKSSWEENLGMGCVCGFSLRGVLGGGVVLLSFISYKIPVFLALLKLGN